MSTPTNSSFSLDIIAHVCPLQVPCVVCETLVVAGAMGEVVITAPALDLRGGDGFYYSLQPDNDDRDVEYTFIPAFCHFCGYVSEDITEEISGAKKRIKGRRYKEILLEGDDVCCLDLTGKSRGLIPQKAALCNAASYLYEKAGRFGDAALQSLYAAWVCDDAKGKKRQAIRFWKQALSLMKKMRKKGEFLRERQGVTELITVDLLRRSKQFPEALKTVEEFLKKVDTHGNALLKSTLFFEKSLIEKKDSNEHSMLEIFPSWHSVPFLSFNVAGLKYREGAKLVKENPKILLYQPVSLLPEPDNEYDENAIAIYWNDKHIGYVPRTHNREILPLIKAGYSEDLIATITAVDPEEYEYEQVVISLSLMNKNSYPSIFDVLI